MKKISLTLLFLLFAVANRIFSQNYDYNVIGFSYPNIVKADTGLFSDAKYYMIDENSLIKALIYNNGPTSFPAARMTYSVYIEGQDGSFDSLVYERKLMMSLAKGDSTDAEIFNMSRFNGAFFPNTYEELAKSNPGYIIPKHFSTMSRNVTPRYKITVKAEEDNDSTNNYIEAIYRFYIRSFRTDNLLSVENSFQDINAKSDKDIIAGRLNADSLITNFNLIEPSPKYSLKHDILDRAGWEPNAVNYSLYKNIFWADGGDKPIPATERYNISRFLDNATEKIRKGFFMLSQGALREASEPDRNDDSVFFAKYFGAENAAPGNPLGPISVN